MDNVPLKDLFPNARARKRQARDKKNSNVEAPQECIRSKVRESLAAALKLCQNEGLEPDLRTEKLPSKRARLEESKRIEKDTETWHLMEHAENVAVDIEVELFKLFSASVKKYNEKARSLIFNLKDRSNPELRAMVLLENISPETLCTMSAKQLASKELCQWRTAKAEELADMIILTDAGADQKVVKKTHKGIFEVQVDKDDALPVLVANDLKQTFIELEEGTSLMSVNAKRETQLNQIDVDVLKEEADCLEFSPIRGSISPSKLLEGLIDHKLEDTIEINVSDGLEKVLDLPTIMSPDEYFKSRKEEVGLDMKSQEKVGSDMGKEDTKDVVSNETNHFASLDASKDDVSVKVARTENFGVVRTEVMKGVDVIQIEEKSYMDKDDKVWEGSFQLSGSQISPVLAFLRSGERVDLESWPKRLEIKGRVRLDALDKFLQELHLSRTRSVMIISFQIENEEVNTVAVNAMKETANQYEKGERVGFAEPVPGFELYLFPTRGSAIKLLFEQGYARYEPREHELLVGCIVWRRTQMPASVTYKTSNQYYNVNRHALSAQMDSPTRPDEAQSLEHDLPPGFGPREVAMPKADGNVSAIQDEDDDDLPEFDFSVEIAQQHGPKTDVANTLPFPDQDLFLHPQRTPHFQVRPPPLGSTAFSVAEKTRASEQFSSLSIPHRPQLPQEAEFLDHSKLVPKVMASPTHLQLHPQVPQFPGIMYPAQPLSVPQRFPLSGDGPFHAGPPVRPLPLADLSHPNKQEHSSYKDHPRSEGPPGLFGNHIKLQGRQGLFDVHASRHQFSPIIEFPRPHGLFSDHSRPPGKSSFGDHLRQGQHGTIVGGQPRQVQHFPPFPPGEMHGQPSGIPITCMTSANSFLPKKTNRGSQSHTINLWEDDDDDMPEWHPPTTMQRESLVSSSMSLISPVRPNSGPVAASIQGSHVNMHVPRPWVNVPSGHRVTPSQQFPGPVRPGPMQTSRFGRAPHQ